jgi:hypothetical protein
MSKGFKHLIECHCTLSIFKKHSTGNVYHKFPVYSKFDDNDNVIQKIVQCNNCGVVHKIVDICQSEIMGGKDDLKTGLDIEDIGMQLPTRLEHILIKNNCDIATWEHALDIIDEERWGESIIISRQIIESKQNIKLLEIFSIDKFKITANIIEDEIIHNEDLNNEDR